MNFLRPIVLICLEQRKKLAEDIATKLSKILKNDVAVKVMPEEYFTDGAPNTGVDISVRNKHTYIVSDVYGGGLSSINDVYMTTRALTKTIKDFGTETLNILYTSFPYARDDKYDDVGNSTSPKRKANLANLAVSDAIQDGNNYCITLDLHNPATFNQRGSTKFVNLPIGWLFDEILQRENLSKTDTILSGCDEGSYKKITKNAKDLSMKHLMTLKEKDYSQAQEVEKIVVIGEVKDKDIILYDDILDTGGTFCKTIEEISTHQPRSIIGVITHALLKRDALKKIEILYTSGKLQKLYITNSIYHEGLPEYIEIIDTSTLFAHIIADIENPENYEGINYNNNTPII